MRPFYLCASALVLSLALFGCGGGGGSSDTSGSGGTGSSGGTSSGTTSSGAISSSGGGADTQPPAIANPRLSTTSLDFRGGTVVISAEVTDASGVLSVVATVQATGTAPTDVSLSLGTGNTYSGSFVAPANQNTTTSVRYTVSIRATDTRGNVSPAYAAGTFVVSAPDAEDPVPPPPVFPAFPSS